MSRAEADFDPISFLESAVRIESHEDVGEMRSFLAETLADRGVEATVDEAGNTIATKGPAGGETAGPHLVLNTHIDTVSPHVPYERVGGPGGEVRGRGSCDAKGPLAALLAAFLAAEPARGRLTLAVTPDEETLSTGAAALVDEERGSGIDGDLYVVGEPTGLDVCTAAKGRFQGTLTLTGANAHAAEPDSGVNAVAAAESALSAIRSFDAGREPHPQLGAATLTPTVIRGGEAANQVPADCSITLDRRSVPPETAEGFREALEARIEEAVPDEVGVEFALTDRETPFLEAFATDAEHPLVRTLSAAAANEVEGAGATRPFAAATEASYFAPAPTVVFGPGVLADDAGPVAHADREYVRVAEVSAAAAALTATIDSFVGER